jgi:chromosome segregation ATPase
MAEPTAADVNWSLAAEIDRLRASLAAKDEEIERLTRARDDLRQLYHGCDHLREQAESALAEQATFRDRDKAEIAELRAAIDKLTNSTDNGALCLEINDLTARLADALSEVGGLRRALAEAVEVMRGILIDAPESEPEPHYDDFGYFSDDPSDLYQRGCERTHWFIAQNVRAFVAQHGSDSREGK